MTILKTKLSGLLCLLLCSLCLSPLQTQAEENPEGVQQKLNSTQSLLNQLKDSIFANKKLETEHQSNLLEIDKEIELKKKGLEQAQQTVVQKEIQIKNLEEKQTQLSENLEKKQHLLAQQLRRLYLLGQNNGLKIMLNLESPQDLDRVLHYYPYLKTAYSHSIQETYSCLGQLQDHKMILHAEKTALNQLLSKKEQQLADIQALKNKQQSLLQSVQSKMQVEQKQLQVMQAEEESLFERLKTLEAKGEKLPLPSRAFRTFKGAKGRLSFPLQGKAKDAILASLPSTSSGNPVMIQSEPLQEVRAIFQGRVVFAEVLRGFGLLMIVDHGEGYMSLYGHNQELYKKIGDPVRAGDLIARVAEPRGELRNSSLYFEIRKNGKPINLVGWFK